VTVSGATPARRISGAVFAAILLVVAALLFYFVYLVVSPTSAFQALLWIGFLALVFALVAYLMESAVAQPLLARAVSWGFMGMGFTVLFVTIGLYPDSSVTTTNRIELAIGALVLLAIAVLGVYWRSGQLPAEAQRNESRAAWQARPTVSAFDYTTSRPADVPPPTTGTPPRPPSGV
jgi:hypothetical protein